jgi:hypothetical protein
MKAFAAATLVFMLVFHAASAQERCKFSVEWSREGTTFPHQLRLDVGDMPGHSLAVYEIVHNSYPNAKPNCEGFKVVEMLTHATADTIDRNGRVSGYTTITLDNGDKIHAAYSGTTIAVTGADGSLTTTFSGTSTWTGGTGRYVAVRGFTRDHTETLYVKDNQGKLTAKTNTGRGEGEYWFEK